MQQMELIEKILSEENLNEAIKKVKSNKGAPGVDKMSVAQIDDYFKVHKKEIISSLSDNIVSYPFSDIESIAEKDDEVLEKYLSGEEITEKDIKYPETRQEKSFLT